MEESFTISYKGYKCIPLSPFISGDLQQQRDAKWSKNRKNKRYPSYRNRGYKTKPHFCIKQKRGREIPDIYIKNGSIPDMRCTQISEPMDTLWTDPFICVPEWSWYHFTWHHDERIDRQSKRRCMKWKINGKNKRSAWKDNYLCAESESNGFGKQKHIIRITQ